MINISKSHLPICLTCRKYVNPLVVNQTNTSSSGRGFAIPTNFGFVISQPTTIMTNTLVKLCPFCGSRAFSWNELAYIREEYATSAFTFWGVLFGGCAVIFFLCAFLANAEAVWNPLSAVLVGAGCVVLAIIAIISSHYSINSQRRKNRIKRERHRLQIESLMKTIE